VGKEEFTVESVSSNDTSRSDWENSSEESGLMNTSIEEEAWVVSVYS
jgi:hypothetical protein